MARQFTLGSHRGFLALFTKCFEWDFGLQLITAIRCFTRVVRLINHYRKLPIFSICLLWKVDFVSNSLRDRTTTALIHIWSTINHLICISKTGSLQYWCLIDTAHGSDVAYQAHLLVIVACVWISQSCLLLLSGKVTNNVGQYARYS